MTQPNTRLQAELDGQMLLPGHHNCLTWQLNVTVYPKQRAIRWVSILRDPEAQVEIERRHQDATDASAQRVEQLQLVLAATILELRRLSGWAELKD